jgi:hypothetical protein
MNRYSLPPNPSRWYWTTALGGTVATSAVATLFVLVAGNATASQDFRDPPGQVIDIQRPALESPCFIQPNSWNAALDGPLPLCATPGSVFHP